MAIWVSCRLRRVRVVRGAVERLAAEILTRLGYQRADVSVTFIGDRAMRTLNRCYRRRDRPTDVLAFACRDAAQPPSRIPVLGDVVVSVPTAARQAKVAGHTLDRELTLLVVHGILHLCGYDHEHSRHEARRMFRRQRELLDALGARPRLCTSGNR